MNVIHRILLFAGLMFFPVGFKSFAADEPGQRMFERLKTLAGDWEGSFEWSHGRTGSGPLKVSYYLSGGGSALVENLIMGDPPAPMMTSVYHLDGPDLRMTHYCAARNQPRLKASNIDESGGTIDFSFVDVTNARASPAYVNACHIHFAEPDHIDLRFTFGGGTGNGAIENITLKRGPAGHQ